MAWHALAVEAVYKCVVGAAIDEQLQRVLLNWKAQLWQLFAHAHATWVVTSACGLSSIVVLLALLVFVRHAFSCSEFRRL